MLSTSEVGLILALIAPSPLASYSGYEDIQIYAICSAITQISKYLTSFFASWLQLYPVQFIVYACLMVFNATFYNISVIPWRSVLFVEETGGPGKNHRPVGSH